LRHRSFDRAVEAQPAFFEIGEFVGGGHDDFFAAEILVKGKLMVCDAAIYCTLVLVDTLVSAVCVCSWLTVWSLAIAQSDGLTGGEGVFLACSFWLGDCYELVGRHDEALALFRRLCALANDVELLAEEYDIVNKHQLGNSPQAFTHLALVNTRSTSCRNSSRCLLERRRWNVLTQPLPRLHARLVLRDRSMSCERRRYQGPRRLTSRSSY